MSGALRLQHWTIRTRLMVLALVLAVPLNLLVVASVWDLAERAAATQRAGLLYTARSVAAAVDAKLGAYIGIAETLARSPAILADDLGAFEAEARRAFPPGSGASVLVADPLGQQLVNTSAQARHPLPMRNSQAIATQSNALASGATTVSDVLVSPVAKDWVAAIEVPIYKDGVAFRELAVVMDPQSFLRLLNAQQMPSQWLAGIVDGQGRFVARVPSHDRFVGELASEGWRSVMSGEGVFEIRSLENDQIVQGTAHSRLSSWSIGVAVKQAVLRSQLWDTVGWSLLVGAMVSALSVSLAGLIARGIAQPIGQLRDRAAAMLSDPDVKFPSPDLPEVRVLVEALAKAANKRVAIQDALASSEERLKLAITAARALVYDIDLRGEQQLRTFGLEQVTGFPDDGEERRAGWWNSRIHPDDLVAHLAILDQHMQSGGSLVSEYRVRKADGQWIWVHDNATVLFGANQRPVRVVGTIVDVTGQIEAQRVQAQLAAIVTSSSDAIVSKTLDGIVTSWNDGAVRMFGYSEAEMVGRSIRKIIPPERQDEEDMILARLAAGESIEHYQTVRRAKDGHDIEVSVTVSPVRDAKGRIRGASKIARDITDLKQREQHLALLMHEVNHRSKNVLSVVQAVARQTSAASIEEFLARFADRLAALAASHDLLVKNNWHGVEVLELVRSQLAHFSDLIGTRISTCGPAARLSPDAAQAIGMALHELTTNAAKYGALACEGGRVEIAWDIAGDIFSIGWKETGGPPVEAPSRRGFGSRIIKELATVRLEGRVEHEYQPTGVRWRLTCAAARALGSGGAKS